MERARKCQEETRREPEKGKSVTRDMKEHIIKGISELRSSNALIGVVEIITGKPFSSDSLPCRINLDDCDQATTEKLAEYVKGCEKHSRSSGVFAWRPSLPADLQGIWDEYQDDLTNWMKVSQLIPEDLDD